MCYKIIKQLIKANDVTKCNKYLQSTSSNNICSSEISVILIFYKY